MIRLYSLIILAAISWSSFAGNEIRTVRDPRGLFRCLPEVIDLMPRARAIYSNIGSGLELHILSYLAEGQPKEQDWNNLGLRWGVRGTYVSRIAVQVQALLNQIHEVCSFDLEAIDPYAEKLLSSEDYLLFREFKRTRGTRKHFLELGFMADDVKIETGAQRAKRAAVRVIEVIKFVRDYLATPEDVRNKVFKNGLRERNGVQFVILYALNNPKHKGFGDPEHPASRLEELTQYPVSAQYAVVAQEIHMMHLLLQQSQSRRFIP